jgi:WD40 repeat protein
VGKLIAICVNVLSVVAAIIVLDGQTSAQETLRLAGLRLSTQPIFEPERLPQGPVDQRVMAMMTRGGHTNATCVAYSPDGKTLAFGDSPNRPICVLGGPPPINPNGGLIRLMDTTTHRVQTTLGPTKDAGFEYEIHGLRFGSDGRTLLSRGTTREREDDRTTWIENLTVWDLQQGLPRHVITGRKHERLKFAVAPDGRLFAVIDHDGTAQIWDIATARQRTAFRAVPDRQREITSVKFSPDCRSLAFGLADGEVVVRDAASGRLRVTFAGWPRAGERYPVNSLAFSPDCRFLSAVGHCLTINKESWTASSEHRVFDLVAARQITRPQIYEGLGFDLAGLALGGKAVVTRGPGDFVRIWDPTMREEQVAIRLRAYSVRWCTEFSPDRTMLAAADRNSVTVWDLATGQERASFHNTDGFDRRLAFRPDSRQLASTGDVLEVWDLQTALAQRFDAGHTDEVTSLAYSPDGKEIASGSADYTVKIWHLKTGKPRATRRGHTDGVTSIAYARDGRLVASGSSDRTVRLWDPNGKERAALVGHTVPVLAIALSPDGRTLASGGGGLEQEQEPKSDNALPRQQKATIIDFGPPDFGEVRLWDVSAMRLKAAPIKTNSIVNAVAFSPDGASLAVGKDDQSIDFWDVATNKLRAILIIRREGLASDGILCLSYSPDGKWLAAGRRDSIVDIRDMARGEEKPVARLKHNEFVVALAFSPDGKLIAACDRAQTIKFWSTETWKEVGSVHTPSMWFNSVAFSPDGVSLAAGHRDKAISVFPLNRALDPVR